MTVRTFIPEYDLPIMREWWDAHSPGTFPGKLLPPIGIVVQHEMEDVAACWLYLAVGIGVCWLEFPVSRPGLNLAMARQAFETAVNALEEIAKAHGYGVMFAHTLPPIARLLSALGFESHGPEKITMLKGLNNGLRE